MTGSSAPRSRTTPLIGHAGQLGSLGVVACLAPDSFYLDPGFWGLRQHREGSEGNNGISMRCYDHRSGTLETLNKVVVQESVPRAATLKNKKGNARTKP